MRDQKTILSFLAFAVFFFMYTQYLQNKYPEYYAQRQQETVADSQSSGEQQVGDAQKSEEAAAGSSAITARDASIGRSTGGEPVQVNGPKLSAESLTGELSWSRLRLRPDGQGFDKITLKDYSDVTSDPKEKIPVELISESLMIAVNDQKKPGLIESVVGNPLDGVEVVRSNGVFRITSKLKPSEKQYLFEFKTKVENVSPAAESLDALVVRVEETLPKVVAGTASFIPMAGGQIDHFIVTRTEESASREVSQSYCEDGGFQTVFEGKSEKLEFLGYDGHYFTRLLMPVGQRVDDYKLQTTRIPSPEYVAGSAQVTGANPCAYNVTLAQNYGLMQPGEVREMEYRIYTGPKEEKDLETADPSLAGSLNFGWFGAIGKPLLSVIKSIYSVTGNYGLAIVLLTICLKILFYPLTRAAAVNMKKLQVMGPELNRIKAKFEGDKQKQQQEVMKFMGQNKINPAKGCLPILPQIPVFIAFYNVLFQSIELRHAPFFGWIQDLSVADPYYITPVLWGVAMIIQQKLTPNPSMDKTQERVMLMMPIVFTFMMITLPAGLILYMVTNSVVSILQQQWLNRTLKVT